MKTMHRCDDPRDSPSDARFCEIAAVRPANRRVAPWHHRPNEGKVSFIVSFHSAGSSIAGRSRRGSDPVAWRTGMASTIPRATREAVQWT